MPRIATACLLALGLAIPAHPVGARDRDQDGITTADEAAAAGRERWSIKEPETDPCADEDADADTIVVCEERTDPERYLFERPVSADPGKTAGGAPRAPDLGFLPPCEAYQICVKGIGSVPPPAYMVDFDALPETPAGSDAARLYGGPTDADVAVAEGEAEPPVEELPADVQGPR